MATTTEKFPYTKEIIKRYNEEMHFVEGKDLFTLSEDEIEDFEKWVEQNYPKPQNLNTFRVLYIGQTNTLPSRTRIYSERFKQSITVSNHDEKFDDCRDHQERAVVELRSRGFNIVAIGEGDGCMYVMSDTFKPLK